MSKQSLRFLRFFSEQERDHRLLRVSLFRCDGLRVSVESHTNRRMAQRLLHDLQLCTGRSKQRRIGVTKSMPADYKTRGDCQTQRKSYETIQIVGWVVG